MIESTAEVKPMSGLATNILELLQQRDSDELNDPAWSVVALSDELLSTEEAVKAALVDELEPARLAIEIDADHWCVPADPEDIGEAGWAEAEDAVAIVPAGAVLTTSESDQLHECEAVIERGLQGFIEVGEALLSIRDGRLYRASHGTFEDYCRERWGIARSRAYQLMDASMAVSTIVDIQRPANEAQARPLTKLPTPEAQQAAWQEAVETAPEGRVTAAHVETVVQRHIVTETRTEPDQVPYQNHTETIPAEEPTAAQAHPARRTDDRQTWATPQALFDVLDAEFNFTLDAAADDDNHKCDRYFTAETDGLAQSWAGEVVYCNPPYGDKEAWVRKAWTEAAENGAIVVLLIPVGTGTKLWRSHCKWGEVRFITGRLRFDDGDSAAPFDSALVIFRPGASNHNKPGHWQIWEGWVAGVGGE